MSSMATTLASLMDSMVYSGPREPGAVFFEPTHELVPWLARHAAGRTIVEAGAGNGYLLHLLEQAGYRKMLGIELFPRHGVYEGCSRDGTRFRFAVPDCIVPGNAAGHPLLDQDDALVVFARPDHSGWVQACCELMKGDGEALYLGLDRNLEVDLGSLPYEVVHDAPSPAGLQGELVYRVMR